MKICYILILYGLTVGCSTIPGYTEWSEKRQQLSYTDPFNTHLSINCTGGKETRWYKQIGEIEDCLTDGPYIRYNKKF